MSAPAASPLAAPEPWNLVADAYTAELLGMFERFSRDALALVQIPPTARVLDVAAGPGTLTLLAAEAGHSVSAIDFSEQMVKNLRRRLNGAQLGADTRVGDGQALPWEASSFDAAFSMFGLMFFPDRARGLAELRRVLKQGGALVISSWAPFEGIFKTIMASVAEAVPEVPFGSGKGPLGSAEELLAELTAAGFSDVRVSPITHTMPADSVEDVWAVSQRTTAPLVLLARRLGEARWAEISAHVLTRLRATYGSGAVSISSTALLGHAKRS